MGGQAARTVLQLSFEAGSQRAAKGSPKGRRSAASAWLDNVCSARQGTQQLQKPRGTRRETDRVAPRCAALRR
eukprot:CAMPEP_0184516910 /NCGR_PEP_ID=MMETSP0198_2-20121128/5280_1 /TAXON_ID=1112570 /ORGANISM="Thraustochytrium sp., Strain LLF1b" /LENGTH=72 /DNA_ID=CAMNT_0026907261 /DNA_START=13 /DNA_END=227 /DNA_ORIENTATION=+